MTVITMKSTISYVMTAYKQVEVNFWQKTVFFYDSLI